MASFIEYEVPKFVSFEVTNLSEISFDLAIQQDNAAFMKRLISLKWPMPPNLFQTAVEQNKVNVVKYLLSADLAKPNRALFECAMNRGFTDMTVVMVKHGYIPPSSVDKEIKMKLTKREYVVMGIQGISPSRPGVWFSGPAVNNDELEKVECVAHVRGDFDHYILKRDISESIGSTGWSEVDGAFEKQMNLISDTLAIGDVQNMRNYLMSDFSNPKLYGSCAYRSTNPDDPTIALNMGPGVLRYRI